MAKSVSGVIWERTHGNSSQDGHGGHAVEHHKEMEEIARAVVREEVPKIAAEIYNESLTRVVGAMEYDIYTCVSIAVDSVGEIFNSTKVKHLISNRLIQEMRAHLNDIELTLKI